MDNIKNRMEMIENEINFHYEYIKILKAELKLLNINKNFPKLILEKNLTQRQKDVLKLMTRGLNIREMSKKLFITENTVKKHVSNILSIYDVKNRIQLISKVLHL